MDIFMHNKITMILLIIFIILLVMLLFTTIKGFKDKDFLALKKYLNFYIIGILVTGILAVLNIIFQNR